MTKPHRKSLIRSFMIVLFVASFISVKSQGIQQPETPTDSTMQESNPWLTDITLSSRMLWRGIDFGSSPSIQGLLAYKKNDLEAGFFGCVTLNGNKVGYGNTLETYISYSIKKITLTVDDYFFFNEQDSLNNFFELRSKKTQHFVEGRVKYNLGKFAFTGAYVLHTAQADHTKGIYLEMEYSPSQYITIFSGGLTGASMLNFQGGSGITNIGITGKRTVSITRTYAVLTKLSLIASPNYKQVAELPGVGSNPIYFVLSLTF